MKKTLLFCSALLLISVILPAQVPMGVNYQMILRNANGMPVLNESVTLIFSIIDQSPDGQVVYREQHSAVTNATGLVSIVIGQGTNMTNTFQSIDWGSGPKFLAIARASSSGGTEALGAVQLVSVPYALYADKAREAVNDMDTDSTNEIQTLTLNGDTLILSHNGGSVILLSGMQGEPGPANTLSIGTVLSGATAQAEITGTAPNQALNLVLPQGDTGPANTLSIGTVLSGATAQAEITGTAPNQALNLVLPQGDTGPANTLSIGTVLSGATAQAEITGIAPNQALNLVLPQGDTGPVNTLSIGTVVSGATAQAEITGTAPNQALNLVLPQGDTGPAGTYTAGDGILVNNNTISALDDSPTNEIQVLSFNANTNLLSLSNGGGSVPLLGGGGFLACGQAIPEKIGVNTCPASDTRLRILDDSFLPKKGIDISVSNGNEATGMKLNSRNGSLSNDGVILFSEANNGATGMKISAASGSFTEAVGLHVVAGGSATDEDFNAGFVNQNIGLYIDVKDKGGAVRSKILPNSDIGLYVTSGELNTDFAAYFDGNVGIPHEIKFINNQNGSQWGVSVWKEGPTITTGCTLDSGDLVFTRNGAIKSVLDGGSGFLCGTSDLRLKENISPLAPALSKVMASNPVSYNFISDEKKTPTLGFIAQDVNVLFPELINRLPDEEYGELLTLNYAGFSVIAIKAIQEQQEIIERQEAKIAEQQAALQSQEARLRQLEQQMSALQALLLPVEIKDAGRTGSSGK